MAAATGYVADRDAVIASRSQLDQLLVSVAGMKETKHVILFGHSMGAFLAMEAVRQLKLQHRDDLLGKLIVVLAAADIDMDIFRSQLHDIGKLHTPITLFVSKDDRALSLSSIISGRRPRVGLIDVNTLGLSEVASYEVIKFIDISSLKSSDGFGHDRYAELAKLGAQLAGSGTKEPALMSDVGALMSKATAKGVTQPLRVTAETISTR